MATEKRQAQSRRRAGEGVLKASESVGLAGEGRGDRRAERRDKGQKSQWSQITVRGDLSRNGGSASRRQRWDF